MIGIYKITSPSGHIYIGQSTDLKRRIKHYRYLSNIKTQVKIYASLLKYGYKNHAFDILFVFEENVMQKDIDECELFYFNQYVSMGFIMMNVKTPGNGPGSMPKETKDKISKANTGHHRQKGIKPTDDIKNKRHEGLKAVISRPVLQLTKQLNPIQRYDSVKEAAAAVGTTGSNICAAINKRHRHTHCAGFAWQYCEN